MRQDVVTRNRKYLSQMDAAQVSRWPIETSGVRILPLGHSTYCSFLSYNKSKGKNTQNSNHTNRMYKIPMLMSWDKDTNEHHRETHPLTNPTHCPHILVLAEVATNCYFSVHLQLCTSPDTAWGFSVNFKLFCHRIAHQFSSILIHAMTRRFQDYQIRSC